MQEHSKDPGSEPDPVDQIFAKLRELVLSDEFVDKVAERAAGLAIGEVNAAAAAERDRVQQDYDAKRAELQDYSRNGAGAHQEATRAPSELASSRRDRARDSIIKSLDGGLKNPVDTIKGLFDVVDRARGRSAVGPFGDFDRLWKEYPDIAAYFASKNMPDPMADALQTQFVNIAAQSFAQGRQVGVQEAKLDWPSKRDVSSTCTEASRSSSEGSRPDGENSPASTGRTPKPGLQERV